MKTYHSFLAIAVSFGLACSTTRAGQPGEDKKVSDKMEFQLNVSLLGITVSETPAVRWGAKIRVVAETNRGPLDNDKPNDVEIKSVEYLAVKNLAIADDVGDKGGNDLFSKAVGIKTNFDPKNRFVVVLGRKIITKRLEDLYPIPLEDLGEVEWAEMRKGKFPKKVTVKRHSVQVSYGIARIPQGVKGDKVLSDLADGKAANILELPHDGAIADTMVIGLYSTGIHDIYMSSLNDSKYYYPSREKDRQWGACLDPKMGPRDFNGLITSQLLVHWQLLEAKDKK
jgi:hypothetical protein